MHDFSCTPLNEDIIKSCLKNHIIGKRLIVLDSVDSTNEYLKRHCDCENGTVVTAREQTKGKGRLGRSWLCKKNDSLTFSILLKPNITPSEISPITPLAGLALCKALREYTKLDCKIKWPNDIIVGNKKLAGILTEMNAEAKSVDYLVTGIGINVSQSVFPDEIAHKATSIFIETGIHMNKNELLAVVLEYIESDFLKNNLELSECALNEYTQMCTTIGRNVVFERGKDKISGVATGIAQNGELKVMKTDGTICIINSGEVTVQGIY